MSGNRLNSGISIELAQDQENFLEECDREEERIINEILLTKTAWLRSALLDYYYPPEYFQSPPSGFLVACWVQSRENSSATENPAEKQYWDYQVRGFADEISRRLYKHPISRYVINTIYDCQDCYEKLLQFARKSIPRNIQKTDELWLNANTRLGRAMIIEGYKAIRKKSLVRDVFHERIGFLRPKYAVIAAACDGYFDELKKVLVRDLIDELRQTHPKEYSLDSPRPIGEDSEDTFKDLVTEPQEIHISRLHIDISKLHEVEKVSVLAKWLETIKDPLDQEIARLIIKAPNISLDDLAETLDRPRSTIHDRLKKLKSPL